MSSEWFRVAGACDGEEDAEEGAGGVGGAGAVADAAAVFFNEAARDPEAEAGADGELGGEEGREDALANGDGDAGALVADEDGDGIVCRLRVAVDMTAAEVDAAGLEGGVEVEGVDGVDDEVGEDLADLALETVNAEAGFEVEGAGDLAGDHLAGEEIGDAVEELVEIDFDGAGGVAIEAEGLLGDLGDAGEFGVGGFEQDVGRARGRRGRCGRDR